MNLWSSTLCFVRVYVYFVGAFCIQLQGSQIRIFFDQSVQRHVPEERNLKALTS